MRYALACEAGHDFESWFRSSDDFEAQQRRGLVCCPICGSEKVQKQIMAPQVRRTDRISEKTMSPAKDVALIDPEAQALRQKIAALRTEMLAHSEDVGPRFAEEARNIHYGEAEQRSISGQATAEDARGLLEEGIGFLPIPELPEDRN